MVKTSAGAFKIIKGDFGDKRVVDLLQAHKRVAMAETAIGSGHALDLSGLQSVEISLWTIWDETTLLGCAALKKLTPRHGELKSMHTIQQHRGKGVGSAMLRHIVAEASRIGFSRISLQTSTWPFFRPAIALYEQHGFVACPPFADYREDVNSVFLTLILAEPSTGGGRQLS